MKMEKQKSNHIVSLHELNSLAAKFLLTIPAHLRDNWGKVGFQLEKAYWEHTDQFPKGKVHWLIKHFTLEDFSRQIFQRVPFLSDKIDIVEQVIAEFKEYKKSIPTCGVILLNEDLDKVLLVKSYWTKYWGFPQGKIEENETAHACAAREAYEEIGFNVKTILDPRTWFEKVEIILFQI